MPPTEEPTEKRRHPTWDPKVLRHLFNGTALQRASFDLDAAFYGAAYENRSRLTRHALRVTLALLRQWGLHRYGPATPSPDQDLETLSSPQPQFEDATAWIQHLDELLEPTSLPMSAGWEYAVCWRLDVLHAVAELPPSRWRAFNLFSLGFEKDDVAVLMPREAGEPWQPRSVRIVLREASNHVRSKAELRLPRRGADPQPGTPTSVIGRVEEDLEDCRRSIGALNRRVENHHDQVRRERLARERRAERARLAERRMAPEWVRQAQAQVVAAAAAGETSQRARRRQLREIKDRAA